MNFDVVWSAYYFNPFAIAPTLVAMVSLISGWFIYSLDKKNGFYQAFLVFTTGIFIWLASQSTVFSLLSSEYALCISKLMVIGIILTAAATYHLAATLVYRFVDRKYFILFLYGLGIGVSIFLFLDSVFLGIAKMPYGFFPIVNNNFKIVNGFLWLCLMSCYVDLIIYNLRTPDKKQRKLTHWFILLLFAYQYSFLDILEMQDPVVFPVGHIALLGTTLALVLSCVRRYKEQMAEQFEQMQTELRTTQLMLIESGRVSALASLSAGILHQVSQPVTAIHGFAKFIKGEVDSKSLIYKPVNLIEEQAVYMKTMLGDLMEIVKHQEIKKENVNVNDILKKSIHLLEDEMRIRKIIWDLDLGEKISDIYADAIHIQQAFMNIITNAFQALSLLSKDRERNLNITTRQEDQKIVIIFEDNGPGIVLLDKMRVFEPFFTTKDKGVGIGLSLTKDLISEHQGEIQVESLPDKGAKFTITLPALAN